MNTVEWLGRLIAQDTTSRLSNLALIEEVADDWSAQGLQPWLSFDETGSKANLFVSIPAADGSTEGGLVLSGHTDVVPVDGQHWQSDPFRAEIRDGRLYGRGAADMKGFIASVLAAVPQMRSARLRRPLHIALTYDEEVGCLGAPVMLAQMRARGLNPEHCIVGEPTSMRMVVAHKGIHTFCCRLHGKAAHSSLTPLGVNAVEYAAELVLFLRTLAGRLQTDYVQDAGFDVPFSTLSVNRIEGGTAVNIIPAECAVWFDYRNLPQMPAEAVTVPLARYLREELEPKMRAADPSCRIEWTQLAGVPAMSEAEAQALHELVATLAEGGRGKVAYATEGGQFAAEGIATVICGPGSIEQAHRPDEFVELSQLSRCDTFLQRLIAANTF